MYVIVSLFQQNSMTKANVWKSEVKMMEAIRSSESLQIKAASKSSLRDSDQEDDMITFYETQLDVSTKHNDGN